MTETQNLIGRTALVTGGGSGIGAATAVALAAAGARVGMIGRRADRLAEVAAATGAVFTSADVTDRNALTHAIAEVRAQTGPFDLVVANAGAMLPAAFDSADPLDWDRMIATNITGLLTTARESIGDLAAAAEAGGAADLILISSIGAHIVLPGYSVYNATKAAVTHLTTHLRGEFGPRGVRVRAIEPGMIESELAAGVTDPDAAVALREYAIQNPPIPASAIGDAVAWSAALPTGVNVASMIVLPTAQG
ncbi:SDR family oxidoreductase [Tsukamurella pseudospumae]|uniref:Short-chain dehydrogenase n=1 Tax=Tsukamurella pseudospumae TaxID=239498 RepID=A0A138AID0_9ACTN|nr:SDR family oxidoreductase [Tsukamurella pseudospumae]KXO98561.1 short-chain dehydrogenase [Tsukamurella pseudospumae]KXP10124.1 short-chain dehydrogenase [Tsukamurella pseudospumae]